MIQRAILLVALSLTMAAPRAASAQTEPVSQVPDVRTTATSERSVRPDVATFTLSFSASGRTPLAAGQALAARADSIRTALVRLGLPRDSLTTGYQWYWSARRVEMVTTPHVASVSNGSRYISGMDTSYRASDAIHVRIHEMRLVGPAIDSAMAHAVTEISPVHFEASDITDAQEAALREATDRATRQARAIAEASGGRLGRALSLSSQRPTYNPFDLAFSELSAASYTESATPPRGTEVIERQIRVTVTVSGRWELLPRP